MSIRNPSSTLEGTQIAGSEAALKDSGTLSTMPFDRLNWRLPTSVPSSKATRSDKQPARPLYHSPVVPPASRVLATNPLVVGADIELPYRIEPMLRAEVRLAQHHLQGRVPEEFLDGDQVRSGHHEP